MNSLAAIDVFSDLPEDVVERLSRRCNWAKYDEHDTIIDFDDEMGNVYFITKGKVRVVIRTEGGKEIVISEISDGNLFGEFSALDGETRSANVMAVSETHAALMPNTVFIESLKEYPDFSLHLMRILSKRLRALNTRLTEHSFLDAKHRLYNELLRASRARSGQVDQRIVSPPPVQKELADKIGCRREVVSRELTKLKREGIVEQQRGGLVIAKPGHLSNLISEAWQR